VTVALDEKTLANALVATVCHCGPKRHERGFPECATARQAARDVMALLYRQDEVMASCWWWGPKRTKSHLVGLRRGASGQDERARLQPTAACGFTPPTGWGSPNRSPRPEERCQYCFVAPNPVR
jgi:hypothetical protein